MLEELASIDPTIEFKDVVTAVAIRVVQNAMNRTRAATVSGIRRDFATKEFTTFNGKKYKLSNRYPDQLWGLIDQFRKDRLAVKLASRGLSKQSWVHLASTIGGVLSAPAYVTNANYKGRTYREDGTSTEQGDGNNYALTIINSSPIVQAAGGYGALLRAMQGETSYFNRNMENRAFRTFESRAAKYPGIFVRRAA